MIKKPYGWILLIALVITLGACANQLGTGTGEEIGKDSIGAPDTFTHVYAAKEIIILRAVARVIKEKQLGRNILVDQINNLVDSDYVISGDWRMKTSARVRRINWKECEVALVVTTEKKTQTGWELQRLLGPDQYLVFFSVIELKVYEEMAKIE
jgi:hypothetical protein